MKLPKTFFTDEDGFTQKDFIIMYSTIIYTIIFLTIMTVVIKEPSKYNTDVLDFLLALMQSSALAYTTIVSFFFLNATSVNVMTALLIRKKGD